MSTKNIITFGNKNTLTSNGFIINRRIKDLAADPAWQLGSDREEIQVVFEHTYQDVYAYLQKVMFDNEGTIVWTFAPELERAGVHVFASEIGIVLDIGSGKVEIASPIESLVVSQLTGKAHLLTPTQLRLREYILTNV